MKSKRYIPALIIILVMYISPVFSQPPPPPPPPPCWPPPCNIPINGGIMFVLLLGVAYGTFILYKTKKRKSF